jgi:hypothetical protein
MRPKLFAEIANKSFAAYSPGTLSSYHANRAPTALTRPAPDSSKEVLTVINNSRTSLQAAFGMPAYWRDAVSAAAVRTLPTMGGVPSQVAAGTKRRTGDVAHVCTFTRTADVVVLDGAFPGTSAWSPPT